MFNRKLCDRAYYFAEKLPVIAILGPRQSGKTTMARAAFPHHRYFNLEDADLRESIEADPKGFLSNADRGIIIDEVQRLPELLSYIQVLSDESGETGRFVITGSQNLLLSQHISQSLAGRVALLQLLPLSFEELSPLGLLGGGADDCIFRGGYPRIYDKRLDPTDWYPDYVQTYLERDVRSLKNIDNLNLFHKFLRLCAGRTGQLLNLSSLSNECGISHNTAKSWIGILEASYILYLLQPYHENFNKRIIKTPKLYFHDTGIACSLLGIKSARQVETHYLRGALFETMIMSELTKYQFNRGKLSECFFWKDRAGKEIDCIIDRHPSPLAVEIKSGMTITNDSMPALRQWSRMTSASGDKLFIVYGGDGKDFRHDATVVGWRDCFRVFGEPAL